jgi:hypothetical protein
MSAFPRVAVTEYTSRWGNISSSLRRNPRLGWCRHLVDRITSLASVPMLSRRIAMPRSLHRDDILSANNPRITAQIRVAESTTKKLPSAYTFSTKSFSVWPYLSNSSGRISLNPPPLPGEEGRGQVCRRDGAIFEEKPKPVISQVKQFWNKKRLLINKIRILWALREPNYSPHEGGWNA